LVGTSIFSLGVVNFEMATSQPFKGDTQVSLLSSIIKDTPSSLTDLKAEAAARFLAWRSPPTAGASSSCPSAAARGDCG